MAGGKEKAQGKRTVPNVGAGEPGRPLGGEARKAVSPGADPHRASTDHKITVLPTSDRGERTRIFEPASASQSSVPMRKDRSEEAQVGLIPPDTFRARIDDLQQSTTIKNDREEDVAFEGETKEDFIRFCEQAYPVAEKMLSTVYETGRFLSEVREVLKPEKLFLRWLEFTGFRDRRYYRYMRVYGRFGEKLVQFSDLGIRKLEAASRLDNCLEYLEKHTKDAKQQTVKEFEQTIRKLRSKKKKGGRGRPPTYEEIAGCRLRRSGDGTKIVVEGLSKKRQSELFTAIKGLLSKAKSET